MALILSDKEIRPLVCMDEMIPAIELLQKKFGEGLVTNLPRRKMIGPDGMLAVMGGALFYDNVMGVKTYSVFKGKYSFQVSLYDSNTGELLCYTQANRLGQLRTGATTAVAAKYLLAANSEVTLGLIGSGNQSFTQVEAIKAITPIKEVLIYSKTPANRLAMANRINNELNIQARAVETSQELTSGSNLVVCVAATMEPIVTGSFLKAGTLLIAAGPTSWRARELDDETIAKSDKIIVDSIEQINGESGDLSEAQDRGHLQVSQITELRHVVAGTVPGRDTREQIILAKLMGTGIADVAAAKLAYDKASQNGIGISIDW
jgi:alanine dehydrogenase